MARVPRAPQRVRALNPIKPTPAPRRPKISLPHPPKINFHRHTRALSFFLRDNLFFFRSLFLFLSCLVLFLVLFLFVFRAQNISCLLDNLPCHSFLEQRLQDIFYGRRLLMTNVEKKITAADDLAPHLSLVSLRRYLPFTLELEFTSTPFLYQFSFSPDNKPLFVDANSQIWPAENPFVIHRPISILSVSITDPELISLWQLHQTLPSETLIILHDFSTQYLSREELFFQSSLIVQSSEIFYLDFITGPDYIFDPANIDLSWQKYDWLVAHSAPDLLDQYESINLHFNSPVGILK